MTILDIVLVIPLLYGFVRGLYKGLIKEIASIFGLIGGLILAFFFSEELYVQLSGMLNNPGIEIRVLSFIIIFIVVQLAISVISKGLTKAMDAIALGGINHVLGGIFGLAKWFTIMLIVVYFIESMREEGSFQKETFQDSFVYQRLVSSSTHVSGHLDDIFGTNEPEAEVIANPLP